MKKFLFLFGSIVLFVSCQKENITNETEEIHATALKERQGKPEKITVCHYFPQSYAYKTIVVTNGSELKEHLAHGDCEMECQN